MPPDGAVAYELNDGIPVWGTDTFIFADIANSLRLLFWAKTEDGIKGRNRPDMIAPQRKKEPREEGYSIEELDVILKKKRV